MDERNVATWEEFLKALEDIRRERTNSAKYKQSSPLHFRGQSNSRWRLSSTLERMHERMLYKDYYRIVTKIKPQIESLMGTDWPIPSYPDVEQLASEYNSLDMALWTGNSPAYAYMAYLRHHSFPSPLLDWSRSPYVASYFAFANASKVGDDSVAIFVISDRTTKISGNGMPVIYGLGPYVKTHRRHVLQQSQYTVCLRFETEWRFENYDSIFQEGHQQQAFCWKFNIPITERTKVLSLLDEQNLNAFSLYGSEEGLMETLANREFR